MKSFTHNNVNIIVDYNSFHHQFEGKTAEGDNIFYIDFDFTGNGVKIFDFKSFKEKQGYGSRALLEFEKWAKAKKQVFIKGIITESPYHSSPDFLMLFYKKKRLHS